MPQVFEVVPDAVSNAFDAHVVDEAADLLQPGSSLLSTDHMSFTLMKRGSRNPHLVSIASSFIFCCLLQCLAIMYVQISTVASFAHTNTCLHAQIADSRI